MTEPAATFWDDSSSEWEASIAGPFHPWWWPFGRYEISYHKGGMTTVGGGLHTAATAAGATRKARRRTSRLNRDDRLRENTRTVGTEQP